MKIKQALLRFEAMALCVMRKWWRPLTCMGIATSVFVNLVIIPLVNWQPFDMTSAALFVGSVTGAFAVREWGKSKGTVNDAPVSSAAPEEPTV